jgi:hypothetical protein
MENSRQGEAGNSRNNNSDNHSRNNNSNNNNNNNASRPVSASQQRSSHSNQHRSGPAEVLVINQASRSQSRNHQDDEQEEQNYDENHEEKHPTAAQEEEEEAPEQQNNAADSPVVGLQTADDELIENLFADLSAAAVTSRRAAEKSTQQLRAQYLAMRQLHRQELEDEGLMNSPGDENNYEMVDFEAEVDEQAVMVEGIDVGEIQLEEKDIEKRRVERLIEQQKHYQHRLERLKHSEIETKERLYSEYDTIQAALNKTNENIRESDNRWQEQQKLAFSKVKTRLVSVLGDQQQTVREDYGHFSPSAPILPDGRQRNTNTGTQNDCPRLLRLKLQTCRAVKNKLAGGSYMIMLTIFDRLGGHPLRWSKFNDSSNYSHTAFTPQPVKHSGKFYELELKFNQEINKLYLVCPAVNSIRMNNVVIVELFACRGLQRNSKRKKRIKENVVAWGAFPLSYINKNLIEGKFRVPLLRGEYDPSYDKYEQLEDRIKQNLDYWLCNLYFETSIVPTHANYNRLGQILSIQYNINNELKPIIIENNENIYSNTKRLNNNTKLISKASQLDAGKAANKSLHARSLSTQNFIVSLALDSKQQAESSEQQRRIMARDRVKELRLYKNSVTNVESDEPVNQLREKFQFLFSELSSDIGRSRVNTIEFWTIICMLLVTFWLRIYIHYFGQYLWVAKSLGIKVYSIIITSYTVDIYYNLDPSNAIQQSAEILAAGPTFCLIIYAGLILFTALLQKFLFLPDTYYRFVFCLGLNIMANPLYITLIDMIRREWRRGDYFILYHAFDSSSTSSISSNSSDANSLGWAGAILTLILATIFLLTGFTLLLIYVLNLHMNRRMMDIYRRLHAEENQLFLPHDLEISPRVLRYILTKSKAFKGMFGTNRKVLATSYTLLDHLDPKYCEVMLHISIYNVTPKQGKKGEQRELYRHFVRDHQGRIIEAFDSVEALGAENMKAMEEQMLYESSAKEQESLEDFLEQQKVEELKLQKEMKDQLAEKEQTSRVKLTPRTPRTPRPGEVTEEVSGGDEGEGAGRGAATATATATAQHSRILNEIIEEEGEEELKYAEEEGNQRLQSQEEIIPFAVMEHDNFAAGIAPAAEIELQTIAESSNFAPPMATALIFSSATDSASRKREFAASADSQLLQAHHGHTISSTEVSLEQFNALQGQQRTSDDDNQQTVTSIMPLLASPTENPAEMIEMQPVEVENNQSLLSLSEASRQQVDSQLYSHSPTVPPGSLQRLALAQPTDLPGNPPPELAEELEEREEQREQPQEISEETQQNQAEAAPTAQNEAAVALELNENNLSAADINSHVAQEAKESEQTAATDAVQPNQNAAE